MVESKIIDKALLQSSLQRWKNSFSGLNANLIPRRKVPGLPSKELALAISGVRRCGKTTLALQLSRHFSESEVLYYNFEDPLFLDAVDPKGIEDLFLIFEQVHGRSPELTILDEIQNVPGWERWVRSAIDQRRSRFIVTGSNAKLLSADLATSLTGRSLEYVAWPLCLTEVIDFLTETLKKHSVPAPNKEYCLQYILTWGGLPAVLLLEDDTSKERLLRQYLSDLVHRDIINRRDIRNKKALDQILTYYQTNISSLHSYSAIKKAFGVPIDTIAEYTSALNEAFIVFEVERYHKNLKVQSRDPRKVYTIDHGLRRISARSPEADIGKLLENLIYLELRRRDCTVNYYKNHGEVDFIVSEKYEPKEAIQVCAYGMDNKDTRQREVSSLLACMSELSLNESTIVTMDRDEIIKEKGFIIRSVSAVKWLSGK